VATAPVVHNTGADGWCGAGGGGAIAKVCAHRKKEESPAQIP